MNANTNNMQQMTPAGSQPVVDAGTNQTVDEGSVVSSAGAFSDPGTADTVAGQALCDVLLRESHRA